MIPIGICALVTVSDGLVQELEKLEIKGELRTFKLQCC